MQQTAIALLLMMLFLKKGHLQLLWGLAFFFKSAYKVMSFIRACLPSNEKHSQAFRLHPHKLAANGQAVDLERL